MQYNKDNFYTPTLDATVNDSLTIKIGDSYIAKPNLRAAFRNKESNLLGVKILENFSVILDLINYDLYLKPIRFMQQKPDNTPYFKNKNNRYEKKQCIHSRFIHRKPADLRLR
jgi:hypothetical protein